jgi:hypothetical protein
MLEATDRRDPATAEAAPAPTAVTHAPALLRKLADGTYRVEVHGEPGVPRAAAVHFSLLGGPAIRQAEGVLPGRSGVMQPAPDHLDIPLAATEPVRSPPSQPRSGPARNSHQIRGGRRRSRAPQMAAEQRYVLHRETVAR